MAFRTVRRAARPAVSRRPHGVRRVRPLSSSSEGERSALPSRLPMRDGNSIPVLGLGTYLAEDPEEVRAACLAALRCGYTHIDTAEGYENERDIGGAIAEAGVAREELFLSTKLWPGNAVTATFRALSTLDSLTNWPD
jgi:diketogulonate reductase-like aldo/keto reductase